MNKSYTNERNVQIVIALLKAHGIRKVIVSPGTTNVALVGSIQYDPWFEIFSAVDERSAAYMACGLAAEAGEPVVLSCTGATASRNYMPGLTEAYYRKLPVLAITSIHDFSNVGHLMPQVIDRTVSPRDVVGLKIELPSVRDDKEAWNCEIKVNKALLELKRKGGGPVHINLATGASCSFCVKNLPAVRMIERIGYGDIHPEMPAGRIAVFAGSHARWSPELTEAVDRFCASRDAVVFCDHTSGYHGKYKALYALVAGQEQYDPGLGQVDLLIHIGEVSGDYFTAGRMKGCQVWRVSEDGEIRDTFRRLRYVFEMSERSFFKHYTVGEGTSDRFLRQCRTEYDNLYATIPDLPFSNVWIASRMAPRIPEHAVVHFGILNTLRSWNMFRMPESVVSNSNVGGFGIDGGVSTLVGASLADPDRLCFCFIGDLAVFYDMNAIGNRHVGNNIRIMLINNGKGTEFRNYFHPGQMLLGDDADRYVAAAGHYGNRSRVLVRHYAEDLGFTYLCASDKKEFERVYEQFLTPEKTPKPLLFEVWTNSDEESEALRILRNIKSDPTGKTKHLVKQYLGPRGINFVKNILKK